MATYLYTNFAAFKLHAGAAVNNSVNLSDLSPSMDVAAEAHILPWLGRDQWGDLINAVENESLTAPQTALLPYAQRALTLLTLSEYTNVGEVQVSASGIMRAETDNMKSAYKNQVSRLQKSMLINGYAAIERMLEFLQSNRDNYPLWTAAPESSRTREAFINNAATFRLVYSTNISRYVMESLRGVMLDVEQFAMVPLLGQAFFDEIKAVIASTNAETPEQQTIINYAQKAIASFSVEEGIRRNLVQNTGISVVVNEVLEPQGNIREGAADSAKLRQALRHNDEWGNRHINALKTYLDANRSAYPTYQTWIEAQEAAAEETEETTERDSCYNGAKITTKVNKSVFRL